MMSKTASSPSSPTRKSFDLQELMGEAIHVPSGSLRRGLLAMTNDRCSGLRSYQHHALYNPFCRMYCVTFGCTSPSTGFQLRKRTRMPVLDVSISGASCTMVTAGW